MSKKRTAKSESPPDRTLKVKLAQQLYASCNRKKQVKDMGDTFE